MAAASVVQAPPTGPSSPMKQTYYAPTPNYYSANASGSERSSKRSCETVKTKRNMMHSPAQRKSAHGYNNRSPALERVAAGVVVTGGGKSSSSTRQSPTQVPSGSTEFTTRRSPSAGFGAGGLHQNINTQQQPHSNSPPKTGSPKKTARKSRPKPGSNKPSSTVLTNGRPPSPHPIKLNGDISKPGTGSAVMHYKQLRKASSTVDSGHGDDLSSSCDSDSQSKVSSVYQCNSPVKPLCSSSCSDVEDDVFLDALSYLPSGCCGDEQAYSTSTSKFVTPSQSPLPNGPDPNGPDPNDPDHANKDHFAQTLTVSLEKVVAGRTKASIAGKLGQVDPIAGVSTSGAHSANQDSSTGACKNKQKSRSKKRLNGKVIPQQDTIGSCSSSEVHCTEQQVNGDMKFVSSRNRRKKKVVDEATTDSGDSAVGKGGKSLSSLKVPRELPSPSSNHQGRKHNKSHKVDQQMSLEISSISSASPTSSVCSHSPQALSPSPTSSISNSIPLGTTTAIADNHTLQTILPGNGTNLNSKNKQAEVGSEAKDEWPDLGMDSTPPKPPAGKVHLHLEVEAKSLESSPECRTEEEDSGCNMSVGSSSESCAVVKQQLPMEQPTAVYPVYGAGGVGGVGSDMLSPATAPPPAFSDPHLQSQQYLWAQSQQLNMFIQQHKERCENQTDNQIFFPMDLTPPLPQCNAFPPPLCPMQLPLALHLPPPLPPTPPHPAHTRPLFFPLPLRIMGSAPPPDDDADDDDDVSCPPAPPPPPPIPVHHYSPAGQWVASTVQEDDDVGTDLGLEGRSVVSQHDSSTSSTSSTSSQDEDEYEYHYLNESWVMWYDKITGSTRNHCTDYQASLKQLLSISSVEVFWQLYNNIMTPAEMDQNSNFHFFKSGIQPLWEDSSNREGGKWVLTIKNDTDSLAKSWLEVLLLLIGSMEKSGKINGAVVSRRKKGDRISLWTSTRKEKTNLEICTHLIKCVVTAYGTQPEDVESFVKQLAEGKKGLSLVFMHHCDALRSGHSFQNDAHITLIDHLDVVMQKLAKVFPK